LLLERSVLSAWCCQIEDATENLDGADRQGEHKAIRSVIAEKMDISQPFHMF